MPTAPTQPGPHCPVYTTVAGDPWHGCALAPGHEGQRHDFTRRLRTRNSR